mgnify:CR=1 FL=1
MIGFYVIFLLLESQHLDGRNFGNDIRGDQQHKHTEEKRSNIQ